MTYEKFVKDSFLIANGCSNARTAVWSIFWRQKMQQLQPLPETSFEIQYDTELTVSANCCVYLGRDKHYYSVPYQHIGQKVKVIYTRTLVKMYLKGERIATHPRVESFGYSMQKDHLASHSNAYTNKVDWEEKSSQLMLF